MAFINGSVIQRVTYASAMDEGMLRDLRASADGAAQSRVLQYFEQLKMQPNGWQHCIEAFAAASSVDSHVKFFCFQVLEYHLRARYHESSTEEQNILRHFLSQWISQQSDPTLQTRDAVYLLNKAAQIFCLVFLVDFPCRWPTFFDDLLSTLTPSPIHAASSNAVDIYLRILIAIDSEIADRDFSRCGVELERNMRLKDAIRERSIQQLVDSWYNILVLYKDIRTESEIVRQGLRVVGAYVAWIDINLIANSRFVSLLVELLKITDVREAGADCLHDVLGKGMEPVAKTQLVESLADILQQGEFFTTIQNDSSEFPVKLARVVNEMGVQLIDSYNKLQKHGQKDTAERVQEAITAKIPLLLEFFGSEYDDVSSAVMDFARDYIHLLKGKPVRRSEYQQHLEQLLGVCLQKMHYDDSYNFEHEGEDEGLFQEYRKQLKVVFENIAAIEKEMVIAKVQDLVLTTLQQWQMLTFEKVEAALAALYLLGEVAPASDGEQRKVQAMRAMMAALVGSGVSAHRHPAVANQFFRTVVRYEKLFDREPSLVGAVLAAFLDERGMRHSSPSVRSNCAYLFCRFVKAVRSHIHTYTENVLQRLQELLALLPLTAQASGSLLTPDDLNYLYEAAGILIVSSPYESQRNYELLKSLLMPLLQQSKDLANELANEQDEKRQVVLAQALSHAMALTSRTSKAFNNQKTVKSCGCVDLYIQALHVFLLCLEVPHQQAILQAGVRQYVHRMVVCLEEELLPLVPTISESLVKRNDVKSVQEYIPLINQIVAKFKLSWLFQKEVTPFLRVAFLPLVSTIIVALATPSEDNDEDAQQEKQSLRRSYFQLLHVLVQHSAEVLNTQECLEQVLLSLVQGAAEFPDPPTQKTCFVTLRRLVQLWGAGQPDVPACFKEFLYSHLVPACFVAPLRCTFDLNDGQCNMVLTECGLCLRAVLEKRGEELIIYLRSSYLPSLRVAPSMIDDFCRALCGDPKTLRIYLREFFQRAKS